LTTTKPLNTTLLDRRRDGVAVYTYERIPSVPPVSVMHMTAETVPALEYGHSHAHDFLLLAYFETRGGVLRVDERRWQVEPGDVFIIAPGEVLGTDDTSGWERVEAWGVYFPPDILGASAPGAFLSWRTHPLLFPFVRGVEGGVQRLNMPPVERPRWTQQLHLLHDELRARRDGYHDAVLAYLTLLLVAVGRVASNVAGDLRLRDEPILAGVFGFIEEHYAERISLRDVAAAVYLSPGYLTTLVRRKTGRTVQAWIAERRMTQARRLLAESSLSVEEVARRVGFDDPGYFARSFRRAHGTTARAWRDAGHI